MAKGNLFLGTARKKLGDVVFYRRDGVQQARVRVRTISNPQTEGQALQRSYLAPINKFYSPLAGVLETSWEGLNRLNSHNAFQSAAVRDARANGWYVPKGEGFYPLPYQISKGILPSVSYQIREDGNEFDFAFPLGLGSQATISTVGQLSAAFISQYACQEGDQVTFIICVRSSTTNDYIPTWARFFIDSQSTVEVETALRNPFFEFTATQGIPSLYNDTGDFSIQAGAVILSRYDAQRGIWLRSSQWLVCSSAVMDYVTGPDARARAIASYQKSTAVNTSDVYLNGSEAAGFTVEVLSFVAGAPSVFMRPVSLAIARVPFDRGSGQTGVYDTLVLVGEDIANGSAVRAVIFSAPDGVFLHSKSEWYDSDVAALMDRVVVQTASDDIWLWLKSQGVTADDPS